MSRFLIIFCVLAACGKAKSEPTPAVPTDPVKDAYTETQDRLEARFLNDGMVVSLGGDEHLGDSLLWSGIALGSEDCDHQQVDSGLRAMVDMNTGALSRHTSLPAQVSLDGALGFYYGVAARNKRCPKLLLDWKNTLMIHQNYMAANGGKINAKAGFVVPAEFDFVQQALFAKLGLAAAPSVHKLNLLADEVAVWAEGVRLQRSACYRVHLGWLALRTAELLGYTIDATHRNRFCAAEVGLNLPVIEHWCGVNALQEWLDTFAYNRWEYAFQRCPAWETPDGNGYETPAVDRLIGLTENYSL